MTSARRMRIPILTESYFFRLALLIAVSIALGAFSAPLAGVLLFAAGMLAAVAYEMLNPKPRRSSLREAVHATHRHGPRGEQRHVLLVADGVLGGDRLRRALSERTGAALRLDVLAPVLSSRAHYWTSDLDAEIDEARRRLEASLAWLTAQGLDARGEVGDPNPLTAIEDELRDFGADEVIVVTGGRDRSNRAEADMLARLRAELDVPVSHIVVDSGPI